MINDTLNGRTGRERSAWIELTNYPAIIRAQVRPTSFQSLSESFRKDVSNFSPGYTRAIYGVAGRSKFLRVPNFGKSGDRSVIVNLLPRVQENAILI